MVLNYTGGSPCDGERTKVTRKLLDNDNDELKKDDKDNDQNKDSDHRQDKDDDDDEHRKDDDRKHSNGGKKGDVRRKSTIISFLCERDSLAPNAHLSFIGASEDECTYFFEAKAKSACGGVNETQQSLGPGGVFGVMCVCHLIFRGISKELWTADEMLQSIDRSGCVLHRWHRLSENCNASTWLETIAKLQHLGRDRQFHLGTYISSIYFFLSSKP